MAVLIRYDIIGKDRAVRTITRNGKIINVPGNLNIIKFKIKSDLTKDFNKFKRRFNKN